MKEFVSVIVISGYYKYNLYKITDSAGYVFYMAEPVSRGVTRTSEKIEDLRQMLNKDSEVLNAFWAKVK